MSYYDKGKWRNQIIEINVAYIKCSLLITNKAALDAGENVAVEAGKKMVEKVIRPKTSNRTEQIVNKYITTTKGNAIAIQDLV